MSEFDLKFFLLKVNKTDTCWIWTAALGGGGYGQCTINKITHKAHRLSYRYFNGEIPANMVVMHKCDNRVCVNPLHLKLGTVQDNIKDMFNKGRQGGNSVKSLTKVEIDEVNELRRQGFTYIKIAELLRTSETTVYRAVNKIRGY